MTRERDEFRGAARLLRGAVLGGGCLLLTEIGHTAAGGGHLDIGMGLAAVVALALGTAWAQRRRSVGRLVVFIAAVQLLLHLLMVMSGAHGGRHVPLVPAPSMIVAHALAAVGMALVLNFGEATLRQWMAFLASLAGPRPVLPALAVSGPVRVARARDARGTSSVLARRLQRRGPPST